MHAFAPRRPEEASRWLAALLLAATVLVLVVTPLTAAVTPVVAVVMVLDCTVLVSGAVAIRRGWRPGARTWLTAMACAVVMVLVSNIVTDDASAAAQIYFMLPAVAAAPQLRPRGAWLVTGLASAGHLVHVLVMLAPRTALVDWASTTAFTVVFVGLLSRAADRQEQLLADLERQASVDAVTGLSTRRVLDAAAAAVLGGSPLGTTLVIVDVDHFKSVNDVHGHPVGDAALAHVGRLLVDAAGAGAVVSRLGGDELAVLLPGTTPVDGLLCAERVVHAVRSTPLELPDGGRLALTVSAGVAHSPVDAPGVESLYRAADAALYDAKRAGRNRSAVARRPPAEPADPGRCFAPLPDAVS